MLLKVELNTYSSSDYKLEIVTRLRSYKLSREGRKFVVSKDILTKKGSQGKTLSKEEVLN